MSSQGRGVVLGDFSEEITHCGLTNVSIDSSSIGQLIGVYGSFRTNSAKLTTLGFKDVISIYFRPKIRAASYPFVLRLQNESRHLSGEPIFPPRRLRFRFYSNWMLPWSSARLSVQARHRNTAREKKTEETSSNQTVKPKETK
jgi:hypothetical protein